VTPSAAILSGGRASRFGGIDKGSLAVDGRTILERQLEMLSAIPQLTEILLVGSRSARPPARPIADRIPGCGPLGGIHAALSTVIEGGGDTLFVIACDMPYVPGDLVRYLLALTAEGDAVVPLTESGYHPLCAVYTRACLEPIARRLIDGRLKVADVLGEVKTRVVRAAELEQFGQRHQLLSNVNTPGDYAALQGSEGHQL
jgi:molybdopterin-guanine dinucleotide biosynthesis protein A